MHILIIVVSGWTIFIIGILLGYITHTIVRRMQKYSGIIKIIREDDRVIYSLELQEDPSVLEHVNEVIFRIDSSDESSKSQI